MVVAFASTAFAVDVKLSGGFEVKGIFVENGDLAEDDTEDKSRWEQDGNVQAVFNLGKGTKFTVRGDFHDGTWGNPEMAAKTTGEGENGFTVQRAFLQHVFENGLDLRAGLMATGGWGTAFRNNVEGNYRVRLGVPVANGVLTFQTTKNYEGSLGNYKDSEKDDNDQYGVDYVGKTGAFTYGANLTYRVDSWAQRGNAAGSWGWVEDDDDDDPETPSVWVWAPGAPEVPGNSDSTDTLDLTLLFSGDFGQFGFESEFAYTDVNVKGAKDYDLWGAYINGYGKFGKTTAGLAFVYGSVDKDTGAAFEYGDDFDTSFIIDELGGVGGFNGTDIVITDDLSGFTAFKLYADYAHTDALTLGAAFIYAFSNHDVAELEDVKLYELDVYASYDLTEYLNYTVKAAYLKVNDIDAGAAQYDADDVYYASHTLSVAF